MSDIEKYKDSDPYRFDIVNLQRQILSNLRQEVHQKAAQAFVNRNSVEFEKYSRQFIELLQDMDDLLKTRIEFSFDKWISDARSWGKNEEESNLYEYNATMLVTHWGPDEDPLIFDYSWREWSGLISGYYKVRWEKFYNMLHTHLAEGTEYSEKDLPLTHGREALRANEFYSNLTDWEYNWIHSPKQLHPDPAGDEIEMSKRLFKKYTALYDEFYTHNIKTNVNKQQAVDEGSNWW